MTDRERIDLKASELDMEDRTRRYFGDFYSRVQEHPLLVIGAGAVGTEVTKNLVMMGVKSIHLVDLDRVSRSNLNRCVFFRPEDHDLTYKVDAVSREIGATWSGVEIVPHRLSIQEAPDEVWQVPVVLVCVDNNEARHYVNLRVLSSPEPMFVINGATGRSFLEVQVLLPGSTPCLVCSWEKSYFEQLIRKMARETCDEFFHQTQERFPSISILNSLVGAIMAGEAIKILVGLSRWKKEKIWEPEHEPFLARGVHYDIRSHEFHLSPLRRNPKCVEIFCRQAGEN